MFRNIAPMENTHIVYSHIIKAVKKIDRLSYLESKMAYLALFLQGMFVSFFGTRFLMFSLIASLPLTSLAFLGIFINHKHRLWTFFESWGIEIKTVKFEQNIQGYNLPVLAFSLALSVFFLLLLLEKNFTLVVLATIAQVFLTLDYEKLRRTVASKEIPLNPLIFVFVAVLLIFTIRYRRSLKRMFFAVLFSLAGSFITMLSFERLTGCNFRIMSMMQDNVNILRPSPENRCGMTYIVHVAASFSFHICTTLIDKKRLRIKAHD